MLKTVSAITIATGTSSVGTVPVGSVVLYWPIAYENSGIDVQNKLCQRYPA